MISEKYPMSKILIEPFGIETEQWRKQNTISIILIEPFGIETL